MYTPRVCILDNNILTHTIHFKDADLVAPSESIALSLLLNENEHIISQLQMNASILLYIIYLVSADTIHTV